MANPFFDHPILNSPYECPRKHWELDPDGQPTQQVLQTRRRAEFITPIPKPKKRKKAALQGEMLFNEGLNHLGGSYGRWAFAEFTEVYQIEPDFKAKVDAEFNKLIKGVMS